MAALKYRDEHNRIGFLEKPKGSTDYHQVIDFLLDSHIRYALVTDPLIYDSLITQFWSTASLRSSELGPPAIVATIDGTPYTITESLVRSKLQLHDEGGIVDMPIPDIYLGMDNLGYPTEGKLTFHKNKFSPQWRFLIHTLLHCLSTKSGSWDQFGSPLAIALICLCKGKKFNWSNYIFTGMVNNINNSKKFLMFPRLNFHGDHLPLVAAMLPPPQAAIAAGTSGEAAPLNPQTDHETVTKPVPQTASPHDQASSPPRPTTTPASVQETEQGPFSDPHPTSSSRPHASAPTKFTSINVEDDAFGGSFDISPPRSTKAPPADPGKLTALCSLVNLLVQKIDSQASDLTAHKLVFKEVVGKLIKKVKELEDKLKARKKKFVVTESDIEEEEEQDVDPLIKLAKAAATAADDSAVPAGDSKKDDVPPSSTIPSDAFAGGSSIPPGDTTGSTAAPSDKGKSPMLEEEHPVRKRSFRQREEDRLGEEAAKKLYEEEMAALERETEEMKKKRQQDMMDSAKYYTDDDWINIMGQVHANQGLSADLLGPDVTEDNFAERMVALIAKRRREFAAQRFKDKLNKPLTYAQQKEYMRTFVKNQSSTIYSTGWTMKHVKSFSDDQLKEEFDKIRAAVGELQSQNIRRSLKRPGVDMAQDSSKKSKPTEVPPAIPQMSSAAVPPTATPPPSGFSPPPNVPSVEPTTHSYGTRRRSLGVRKKQLGWKGVHTSHSTIPVEDGDPEAEHKVCIKYASNEDSSSDDDTSVNLYAVVDWELLPTGLGWINVIYRKDNSRKCFTSLREILHLVSRADLMTIYGRVVTYYQDKPAEGVGLVLWGDLKVLIDSPEVNDGGDMWKNQNTWSIQSWKLYSYSGVHVLETVDGLVLHMFVDKKYPLTVNLIERMLDHQLEIGHKQEGNALTTAVQLIAFLKKQISDSRRPKSKVPTGRYVDPTGKDNVIVSAGRSKVIPAGRTILVLLLPSHDVFVLSPLYPLLLVSFSIVLLFKSYVGFPLFLPLLAVVVALFTARKF
ncbi:hypothetical protein Tco_0991112 [Tanacetum coccineum]|uniref:Synaptobrevin, longin-like domain protein n=1 Tax=Tanacetum coccineum TaxID=301880 RepID=A0ABQ5EZ53_9ASTR